MSNICKCRNGSTTECDSDQMAVCISVNGRCRGYCKDIPKGLEEIELINWLIYEFTGEDRPLDQELTRNESLILSSGRYMFIDERGRRNFVSFSLPGNKNRNNLDFR